MSDPDRPGPKNDKAAPPRAFPRASLPGTPAPVPRGSAPRSAAPAAPTAAPAGAQPPPLPRRAPAVELPEAQEPDEVTKPIDLTNARPPAGHVAIDARVRAPSRRPYRSDSSLPPPSGEPAAPAATRTDPAPAPSRLSVEVPRISRAPRFAAPPPLRVEERRFAAPSTPPPAPAAGPPPLPARAPETASRPSLEAKPNEAKPAVEVKPAVEAKPVEAKPVEAKPIEAKPIEAKPIEARPIEARPIEAKPIEAKPIEAKPIEAKPIEAKPIEARPAAEAKLVVEAKPAAAPAMTSRGSMPPSAPGFLIPRPASSAGVVVSPAPPGAPAAEGDVVRERVAQLEVTANAARSIAQRLADQITDAAKRSVDHGGRIAQLERDLAEARARYDAELAETKARAERPLSLEHLERRLDAFGGASEGARTAIQALRVEVDAHSRAFDARKIRIDAIEHELSTLRGEAHLAELRRAIERLDLRMAAIEENVAMLRAEVAARPAAAPASSAVSSVGEPAPTVPLALPTEGLDALLRIKGVGPKTAKALLEAGVASLAAVAAWDDDELARLATVLGKKPAQLRKSGWIESARELLGASAP